MTTVDIIFAQPLGCYIEIGYKNKLSWVRFIKDKKDVTEKRTLKISFELEQYFRGERTEFSSEIDVSGLSPFTQKVLAETGKIKYGTTITYSELAKNIGCKAFRAVGRALANNPMPIVVPCHRVIAKSGIGGYSAGVDIKTRLLELEKSRSL